MELPQPQFFVHTRNKENNKVQEKIGAALVVGQMEHLAKGICMGDTDFRSACCSTGLVLSDRLCVESWGLSPHVLVMVHGGSQRGPEGVVYQVQHNLQGRMQNLSWRYECEDAVVAPLMSSIVYHSSPCQIPSCTHTACPGYEQQCFPANYEHTVRMRGQGMRRVLMVKKAVSWVMRTVATWTETRRQPYPEHLNSVGISREHIVNSQEQYKLNLRDCFE